MKLRYTILYVENVEKTLTFYTEAFGIPRAMLHEQGDYGELQSGETKLSFSSLELMKSLGKNVLEKNGTADTFEIAFETDDVAVALANSLDAGAELVQNVEEMPWGQTTAYVRDLNGFLVELCSAIET
jgi:uncharacterized glyoxalase superfamily protein PhnB